MLLSTGCYLETVQPFFLQAQQTIHDHTQPLFPSTCTQTKYSQHSCSSQLHRQYTKRGIYEVPVVQLSLEPRLSVLDFVSQLWRISCETKSGTESLGSRLSSPNVVHLLQGDPSQLVKSAGVPKQLKHEQLSCDNNMIKCSSHRGDEFHMHDKL